MNDAHVQFMLWYTNAHRTLGLKVTSKDQTHPTLWRAIDILLKIITFGGNKRFLTHFTTTLGKTVYYPVGWKIENAGRGSAVTLRHERKHILQFLKYGLGNATLGTIIMGFLYLFIPFPVFFAWFRYKFEREAYVESYTTKLTLGLPAKVDSYIEYLTGADYFWAWIFKRQVKAWFLENCKPVETDKTKQATT